ncbi:MAG: EamA family transporter [Dorea sp.]|jgi:drug/metabolite transporter (DMT)-like permease|nr:EamA family transporter [Dorea sp.]
MKRMVYLLPVSSGIMWGAGGIFVRILTEFGMDGFTIVFSRLAIAVCMIAAVICFYDKSLFRIKPTDIWVFLFGGFSGILGVMLAYNAAIKQVTLSLAAVLLSMSPIFVLVLAAVLFGEKITAKKMGCMSLALSGCILVSGVLEDSSGMKWSAEGIGFGVLAAFFYAVYSLVSKESVRKKYHAFTMIFYSMLISAAALVPVTDWKCIYKVVSDGGVKMMMFMFCNALIASVLPYMFYTLSLEFMEAGKASILAAGEPVAAMVFGFLFFSEKPTVLAVTGLVLTTAALVIFSSPERKKKEL